MSKRKNDVIADASLISEFVTERTTIRQVELQTGWPYTRSRKAIIALRSGTSLTAKPSKKSKKSKPAVVEVTPEPEASEKPKKKAPRISHIPTIYPDLPKRIVHRFLITSAQDDTPIHEAFWMNMHAYANYMGANIFVGGHTYQLGLFSDHAAKANVYDPRLADYMCHDRVQLTPDLLFIGSANILPTTANPLAGWTTANKGGHVIVPHSRIALQSIPRLLSSSPKLAVSTGTVTMPNYTPRAAGQKSLHHHSFGFTLVEIDVDGEVFIQPVQATEDGCFQHLDVFVAGGVCYPNRRVKAITWGDIHYEMMNRTIALATWGYDIGTGTNVHNDGVVDVLDPEYQIVHDTDDFRRRNHHNIDDVHIMAAVHGRNSNVEDEIQSAVNFVNAIHRDGCQTVMVESNHDVALSKWLKGKHGRQDPENAYFYHELNAIWHRAIREQQSDFNIVEHTMRRLGMNDDVIYVAAGKSFMIGDIEAGMHGDLGISGSRGTPAQFKRLGIKTTTDHTHSPFISEGVYVGGVKAELFQDYNPGLTTWAHADVVQYENDMRTIIVMNADGRWRATGDLVEQMALAA